MGYEWLPTVFAALTGIEAYEVRQVLEDGRRWPRAATGGHGIRVLAIWGRTRSGRHLIVVLRPTATSLDWLIVGAKEMTAEQVDEYEHWEADRER